MQAEDNEPVLTETQMAELSALADGTLAADRRPAVEALLESSAEVRAQFELERGIVERLHAARASDRAPAALRERIESDRERARSKRRGAALGRGRRWLAPWPAAGLSGAVAAVVAAVVVFAGGSGSLTVAAAARVAERGPAHAAPAADPGNAEFLAAHVGTVRFPASLGSYDVAGERTDRLDGRRIVTVYYGDRGVSVSYTVLAQPALPQKFNHVAEPGSVWYFVGRLHGRAAIVWRNDGHTCIISSSRLSSQALLQLV
jgi:anti-sigma factor RsiW